MEMKRLVISMLLAGLVVCGNAAGAETTTLIGSAVPEFELPNLEDGLVNSQNIRPDVPVVLFFFASWSKPCQEEISRLSQWYSEKGSSLEVLAISFDKKLKDLKSFTAKKEIPFPVLFDKKRSCLDKFQILTIPTTFCLNREGRIEKIFVDYDENVEKAIEEWLAQ